MSWIRRSLRNSEFVIKNYYYLRDFFSFPKSPGLSFSQKWRLHSKILSIDRNTPRRFRPHRLWHIYTFTDAILSLPADVEGCIVEAGCFKGISSAKFTHAAKIANRKFVIFDSFEGLPDNAENHQQSIMGHSIQGWFVQGEYQGGLDEVRDNIAKYGFAHLCEFKKGWFDVTMPQFT